MANTQQVAKYFASMCAAELDQFFDAEGFSRRTSGTTEVAYERGSLFVEFSYYVEDAPNYSLIVVIGMNESPSEQDRRGAKRLPLALVDDSIPQSVEFWRFRSELELREILRSMRDDALLDQARTVWDDPRRFDSLYERHVSKIFQNAREAEDARLLADARKAFADHDYQTALRSFVLLGRDKLSPVDAKRLAWARNRMAVEGKQTVEEQ